MGLDFLQMYAGRRLERYDPQPTLLDAPANNEQIKEERIDLDYQQKQDAWKAINCNSRGNWRPEDWPERPIRFVDGKDVGQTIAWLRAPGGYPVPIRLSQIGSVTMRIADGECRREYQIVERVVSMVVDPFPWYEVESFASALQAHDFRLLPAYPPDGTLSYDFEKMRRATQDRSKDEMSLLEEAAIAQSIFEPTVIDGRLEPRSEGFDLVESPIFGVIKTHYRNYLHPLGMQVLYGLEVGQRTPVFGIQLEKLSVLSWYIRLAGDFASFPNWGYIRVEVSKRWFEARGHSWDWIDRLSQTIYAYRSRERSYERAPVTLHPIVRAEESLGALMTHTGILSNRFYHLTGL